MRVAGRGGSCYIHLCICTACCPSKHSVPVGDQGTHLGTLKLTRAESRSLVVRLCAQAANQLVLRQRWLQPHFRQYARSSQEVAVWSVRRINHAVNARPVAILGALRERGIQCIHSPHGRSWMVQPPLQGGYRHGVDGPRGNSR